MEMIPQFDKWNLKRESSNREFIDNVFIHLIDNVGVFF